VLDQWLTSAEAARYLGVGATSVKRWADAGLLPCEKTAGSHRRFSRSVLDQFRRAQGIATAGNAEPAIDVSDPGAWVEHLLDPGATETTTEGLVWGARSKLGSFWRVAEVLGTVLDQLGTCWVEGKLTVVDEHVATEHLVRAIQRVGERLPVEHDAPRILLATAEGEDHTGGLALAELCARELGWQTVWVGARAPASELARAVDRFKVSVVALSAGSWCNRADPLELEVRTLGEICRARNVPLVLGGRGAWPDKPAYGYVVRDYAELNALLERLGAAHTNALPVAS